MTIQELIEEKKEIFNRERERENDALETFECGKNDGIKEVYQANSFVNSLLKT